MKEIKVIVFDLGNVLIPFDFEKIKTALNKIDMGMGDHYAQIFEKNKEYFKNFEKGKIIESDFISQNLKWLDNKFDGEKFCEIFSDMFELNEKTISLLPRLKKYYRLILLSNTNSIHKKFGWEKYEFLCYFEKLILSHEVGALKPEKEIYNAVMDFTRESATSHLFIDDIYDYAAAAKKLGWDAIHFKNYEMLVDELKDRNIFVNI
ncbi:MAG: HAD hydrolase-like protein [Ignavibacterium sp.]|nr:HAD hydrolase-like protein [Melioribacteraceae bacterium]MCO6474624.1 HAD hydrolase-like protein [Melioribacteraceae bacterium]MDD3557613.1 HAD hydrolase-like protein [Melioribacteraceae bacterium]MDD5609847.1 HAD hydrolase-like protein [Ignavibacterium sp.]